MKFPLRVNAVLIDLDGTLLDTIPDLAAAANLMLAEFGRASLGTGLIRTFVGKGIPRLVERVVEAAWSGKADAEVRARALPVFERCYDSVNGTHTMVFPGVIEGLDALRGQGLPLACVTNKSARFTLPLLENRRIRHYFAEVVAGDALPRKKPAPDQLLHACSLLGVAPQDMLMIGDSANDVQAARAAGCPVFCVDYGYSEGIDVRELAADAIVPSLLEAAHLVQKT